MHAVILSRHGAMLAGVALSALAVLAGCEQPTLDAADVSARSSTAPPPVSVARERAFTPHTLATGNVRLQAGARIEVGARASGVVQSLEVTQGSRVARGAVIARLDAREARARLAESSAKLNELEADATQAATDLERVQALARLNGATRQDVFAAETAVATARARVDAALADRDLARVQLDYTIIRAPTAGVVASVTTYTGETVAASFAAPTFVTLIDPTRLECVALVDETDIGHVARGDSATFSVDAYPGREFHGVVSRIAPDATIISGVVDFEVTVRISGDAAALKPQMTANVTLNGLPRRTLLIPSAAVRQSSEGTYVWRRRGGRAERLPVQLGARDGDAAEVLNGLRAGDSVLTAGFPERP